MKLRNKDPVIKLQVAHFKSSYETVKYVVLLNYSFAIKKNIMLDISSFLLSHNADSLNIFMSSIERIKYFKLNQKRIEAGPKIRIKKWKS